MTSEVEKRVDVPVGEQRQDPMFQKAKDTVDESEQNSLREQARSQHPDGAEHGDRARDGKSS